MERRVLLIRLRSGIRSCAICFRRVFFDFRWIVLPLLRPTRSNQCGSNVMPQRCRSTPLMVKTRDYDCVSYRSACSRRRRYECIRLDPVSTKGLIVHANSTLRHEGCIPRTFREHSGRSGLGLAFGLYIGFRVNQISTILSKLGRVVITARRRRRLRFFELTR